VDNVDNSVDNSVDNFLFVRIQNNYFILVVINRFINMWITCVLPKFMFNDGFITVIDVNHLRRGGRERVTERTGYALSAMLYC
jgi:hypothetical protein